MASLATVQKHYNKRMEIKDKRPKLPQICLNARPKDEVDYYNFKMEKIATSIMKKRRVGGKTTYKRDK